MYHIVMKKQKQITGVLGGLAAIVAVSAGTLIIRDDDKAENSQPKNMPQYIRVPLSDKLWDDIQKGEVVHTSSYMWKTMVVEKNEDGTITYKEVPEITFK